MLRTTIHQTISGECVTKTPQNNRGKTLAEIDTSGMTPEQVAELAESTLPKRKPRKSAEPRNNVSPTQQKVSKNVEKHPDNVKSEKKRPKKPMGRPSSYTDAVATQIIERLSNGEPLREICRDDNMPAWTTVYAWMKVRPELAERFAHAREAGEEAIGQDCLRIADDASNDWMEKYDKDGECIGWQLNHDHVQRSKLRIETRLKLLAKWNPKKWGEKIDMNHGGQPENPVEVRTKVVMIPQKQSAVVTTAPLKREPD